MYLNEAQPHNFFSQKGQKMVKKRVSLKCGITPHPIENEDLRQIYFLLTYACNKACPYCIEPNVHSNKYMSESDFVLAMSYAHTLDMQTLYLHGGEPTVHPNVVRFAELAKADGFKVNMFTNGIRMDVLKQLDGIVDEIRFSYEPGLDFMFQDQSKWNSRIKLYIMATIPNYPNEESLMSVVNKALNLGMGCKVRTLNPANPYAYENQFVPYLHDHLLELPTTEIFCDGNKASYRMDNGVIVRLGNLQLNPGHLKYNVDPDGTLHSRFTHSDKEGIIPSHEIEAQKTLFEPLVTYLRKI